MLKRLAPFFASLSACSPSPEGRPHIVGGEVPPETQRDERNLSTVALVDANRSPFCSGTLVGPDLVLTAAHCLDEMGRWSRFEVAFGRDLNRRAPNLYRKARKWRVHPRFTETSDSISNDVALVRFEALPSSSPWQPARMGFDGVSVGERVAIAGFGLTEEGGSEVGVLHQAWTLVHATAGIEPAGSGEFVLRSGDGVDTCRMDSGGPVYRPRAEGGFEVVGITSWGRVCGIEGHYTDISWFRDWIESTSREL